MKKTVADHINEVAAATVGFPLPQRILRLGLKRFSMEAFKKEMRIEEKRAEQQQSFHDKMIAEASKDIPPATWREEYRVLPCRDGYSDGTCVIKVLDCKAFRELNLESVGRGSSKAYEFIKYSGQAYAQLRDPEPVGAYLGRMPDDVVAAYLAAAGIGFPDVRVASGWCGYGDDGARLRVLVGFLSGVGFEIERWEQEIEEEK